MSDPSKKQEEFLDGQRVQFISSRWNGKSATYRLSNHVEGMCDPATCSLCKDGHLPRGSRYE